MRTVNLESIETEPLRRRCRFPVSADDFINFLLRHRLTDLFAGLQQPRWPDGSLPRSEIHGYRQPHMPNLWKNAAARAMHLLHHPLPPGERFLPVKVWDIRIKAGS